MESNIEYYVVSIDGEEFTVEPSFDMIFLYGLDYLKIGTYKMALKACNFDGEGNFIEFELKKSIKKKHIEYEIKLKKGKKDKYYKDRFDRPLKVKIKIDDKKPKKSKKPKK